MSFLPQKFNIVIVTNKASYIFYFLFCKEGDLASKNLDFSP